MGAYTRDCGLRPEGVFRGAVLVPDTERASASALYALRRAADYFRSPVDEQEAKWALRKAEAIVGYAEVL